MIDIAGLGLESCAASLPLIEVVDPAVAAGFVPGGMFPGLEFDGTHIKIPLATLSPYGLSEESADPDSGDSRALAHALLWRIHDWQGSLPSAPQGVYTSAKASVSAFGEFKNALQRTYTLTAFVNDVTGEVESEPEE